MRLKGIKYSSYACEASAGKYKQHLQDTTAFTSRSSLRDFEVEARYFTEQIFYSGNELEIESDVQSHCEHETVKTDDPFYLDSDVEAHNEAELHEGHYYFETIY
jgi:hypothetical protein